MSTPVNVPKLGESVTSAIIIAWLVKDGATVKKDEPVCTLETDKANVDLNCPAAGVLRHSKSVGDTVAVGDAVATVEATGSGSAATAPTGVPAITTPTPTVASSAGGTLDDLPPAVRILALENKLDPATLIKNAPGGKVTKEYVQALLAGMTNGSSTPAPAATAVATKPVESKTESKTVASTVANAATVANSPAKIVDATSEDYDANGERRVKMTKIRQTIARRLIQAQQTAAILTTFNEVDLTEVMSLRTKYKERFQEVHGIGLGFMSFFSRAVVMSLREFPRINAYLEGDDIVYHKHINLGIAVSTERGLAVPVLHKVENMSFAKIENEIKRLAGAVRDNKLAIEELSGGTFTITNGGVFGSLLSTPILNPPQAAILGMHTIQKRPVVINDKIEIRSMMYLALSYDHRLVDGKESISFLVRIKQLLEDPSRLLLEI